MLKKISRSIVMMYITSLKMRQNKNDYRTIRLRIIFFMLAVTKGKIHEIRELKVRSLQNLEKSSMIEVKN